MPTIKKIASLPAVRMLSAPTRIYKFSAVFAALFFITAFTHLPITWVAIGDSITYLNDHPDETGHRITRGYLTDVVEKLPNG